MTLITELKHYVSTSKNIENQNYKVWEKYFKNWIEFEITKIEGEHMVIKSVKDWQFAVSKNYIFDKIK